MDDDLSIFDAEAPEAWLEADDSTIPLSNPFKIGRSSRCSHVIDNSKVSREHTLISYNSLDGSWTMLDLGSKNGSYLNGVKILRPMPLRDGDQIRVGDDYLYFRDGCKSRELQAQSTSIGDTVLAIDTATCWILLADIEGSTRLSQELPPEVLSAKIRTWATECELILHRHQGILNEYLGDGILAFWYDQQEAATQVAESLKSFKALKSQSGLEFRVILHHGELQIGGGVSSGREKLAGRELNFIFKLEKMQHDSKEKIRISQAAADHLPANIKTSPLGEFEMAGFPGRQALLIPDLGGEE